jgi:ABC-type multidrug transport system fused ATPase/permease subunit
MNPWRNSELGLLWRMTRYCLAYRLRWVALLVTTAGVGLLSGALFLVAKLLLDALMGHPEQLQRWLAAVHVHQPDTLRAISALGMVMLALAPVIAVLAHASWTIGQWLANRCMQDLRSQFATHLIDLELSYHSSLSKGDLLSRLTTDLAALQGLFGTLFGKVLQRPAVAVGTVVTLFVISWPMALVVFALMVPIFAVLGSMLRRVRKRSRRARLRQAENLSALEQIISGIRVIKAMGSAATEGARYAAANQNLFDAKMRVARSRAGVDAITNGAIFAVTGLLLIAFTWIIAKGWTTPGTFFSFVIALGSVTSNLRSGNRSWGEIQEALPAAERVFEVLDRPSRIADPPGAAPCPAPRQALRLEQVSFTYGEAGAEVLTRLDLEIPVGTTVALVGESGAGKSTILNLLPRFYDPTAGRVTIDGIDIRTVQHRSLARHFAIVQQESFLFNDTIAANIRYGRPEASDAEVEEAARKAHLHEVILALEGGLGYATPVGDRGDRLSGGQRQRVAIARAFLRDAPVLLLDEPTSALDADTESHIQAALDALLKGRTAVTIAHRLATIQRADLIYVLGKGRGIIERGTHASLIAQNGEYARLVRMQELR